ncbi:sugar phosphate isomerase/epimerase family protein [Catenovulum maritimum]|uniref:Xylose isomerase-like TIM barrel domain-containing protein n=1 Tax=Catenovulum maritimum TaxID=1513271 RepID=A0A0J8GPX5_9ALTE|nr:sugar phosphate isomerase/epimerase [Catenovulum maritimum]KMT64850.1 hypothetical protein XM47_12485 [Catenovulum maritimum]
MFYKLLALISLCTFSLYSVASECLAQQQPKVSVQLHSVKHMVVEDFEGTLTKLAKMGFAGVEFAGRYGPYANDPVALKRFLDSLGLEVSGAHMSVKQLRGDKGIDRLRFLQQIGTKLLIIPHDGRIDKPDQINELIIELKELTKTVAQFGMQLGYHNHSKEFKTFQQSTFWDHLALNTPDNFVLQLDVGWANYAEQDSIAYVKRYPNRTLTTHYKIRTKPQDKEKSLPVIIGQDTFNWSELIKTNQQFGGTQWIVVEQEEHPKGFTPLQSVAASKKGLDKIMKELNKACW